MSDNLEKLRQGLGLIEQEITRLEAQNDPQNSTALPGLRRQQQALVGRVTGEAAIAQHGSTAQGPNMIRIDGSAENNTIVQGNQNVVGSPRAQAGGIQVGDIEAEGVTVGANIQGGEVSSAVKLVEALHGTNISTKNIKGKDITVGLRYVKNSAQPTQQELRQEVVHLRSLLQTAIEAGEFTDDEAAEDAMDDLDRVDRELAKDKPNEWRVIRKLNSATDVLIKCSETTEAVGNVGGLLLKIAPTAALLTQLAQAFFGM